MPDVAVHPDPVWRDRSDFVIFAKLEDAKWEQLWARKLSERRFMICCIPFFAYDLALGDEVEVGPAGGKQYVVGRVAAASGHYTFRVWFGDARDASIRDEVIAAIRPVGCEFEWSSANLLAIDARTADIAQNVADYLQTQEDAGRLSYETGRR